MAGPLERVLLVQRTPAGVRGKWAALNRGIAAASGEIVVTLDADTSVTPTTVATLVRHFALDSGQPLGAVAGVVRVGNRSRNLPWPRGWPGRC